jgi:hypothetical protein
VIVTPSYITPSLGIFYRKPTPYIDYMDRCSAEPCYIIEPIDKCYNYNKLGYFLSNYPEPKRTNLYEIKEE